MKKLFILLFALGSITTVFAQRGSGSYDRYDGYNHGRYDKHSSMNNYPPQRGGRYDDRSRQAEIDRLNRDYDRRINTYRYDRSISSYERQRRIDAVERERREKTSSLLKGAVIGGVAGVVLGVLLSK